MKFCSYIGLNIWFVIEAVHYVKVRQPRIGQHESRHMRGVNHHVINHMAKSLKYNMHMQTIST